MVTKSKKSYKNNLWKKALANLLYTSSYILLYEIHKTHVVLTYVHGTIWSSPLKGHDFIYERTKYSTYLFFVAGRLASCEGKCRTVLL